MKEEQWKRDVDRDILGEGAILVLYGKGTHFFWFYYLSYEITKTPLSLFFFSFPNWPVTKVKKTRLGIEPVKARVQRFKDPTGSIEGSTGIYIYN